MSDYSLPYYGGSSYLKELTLLLGCSVFCKSILQNLLTVSLSASCFRFHHCKGMQKVGNCEFFSSFFCKWLKIREKNFHVLCKWLKIRKLHFLAFCGGFLWCGGLWVCGGFLWLSVAFCGSWVVLGGFGWSWVASGGLGSVRVVLGRFGWYRDWETDRKSTRLNSSHRSLSRMPSSA